MIFFFSQNTHKGVSKHLNESFTFISSSHFTPNVKETGFKNQIVTFSLKVSLQIIFLMFIINSLQEYYHVYFTKEFHILNTILLLLAYIYSFSIYQFFCFVLLVLLMSVSNVTWTNYACQIHYYSYVCYVFVIFAQLNVESIQLSNFAFTKTCDQK